MLALNAQWVHWLVWVCVCWYFFLFLFSIHNSFSCWKYMRDIGKWIYDIYFLVGLGDCVFLFRSHSIEFCMNVLRFHFNEALQMHRVHNTIFCLFSLANVKWMIKWVNNNWMLESTTPMITTINKQSGVFQWLRSNRNTYTLLTSTSYSLFFN